MFFYIIIIIFYHRQLQQQLHQPIANVVPIDVYQVAYNEQWLPIVVHQIIQHQLVHHSMLEILVLHIYKIKKNNFIIIFKTKKRKFWIPPVIAMPFWVFMPHSSAIWVAVRMLSPVTMRTQTPARWHAATAAGTSVRTKK